VDSNHNFKIDGIDLVVDGKFLRANKTTLGADNGIAVAMGLAVLEDNTIEHPEIELLVTVEEETTMRGALELEENILTGNLLSSMNIREPLYISLLKYSNVNLEKYSSISNIEKINFSEAKDGILNWIKYNSPKAREKSEETLLKLENISFSYNKKRKTNCFVWK